LTPTVAHSFTLLSLSALLITEAELKLIAAAAKRESVSSV